MVVMPLPQKTTTFWAMGEKIFEAETEPLFTRFASLTQTKMASEPLLLAFLLFHINKSSSEM